MKRAVCTRRAFLIAGSTAVAGRLLPVSAQMNAPVFSLPIGLPGRVLGNGFEIRHGYSTENTWYNPGWWHTGEDWYLIEGDTAGAGVYAAADGEVVFAGSDYPGRVVIVRHAGDLYSMYGHLDPDLDVSEGDAVGRGDRLGTVLVRTDGRAPSHLHFEIRTFMTLPKVNGSAPRYSAGCTLDCAPGPGYWPIDAPEHPSAMGWRNPTHVIANRMFPGSVPDGAEIVVAAGAGASAEIWSLPADREDAGRIGELPLREGQRYPLRAVAAGPGASERTSAEGYRLWYRLGLPDWGPAWVRAVRPFNGDTGSDERPSSIGFAFLAAIEAS